MRLQLLALISTGLMFVGALAWLGVLAATVSRQGERITKIERVELCSTTVSCDHLLEKLVARLTPSEKQALIRAFQGVTPHNPLPGHQHTGPVTAPPILPPIVPPLPELPKVELPNVLPRP